MSYKYKVGDLVKARNHCYSGRVGKVIRVMPRGPEGHLSKDTCEVAYEGHTNPVYYYNPSTLLKLLSRSPLNREPQEEIIL